LLFCAHDVAERCLTNTDLVAITGAVITINHNKLQLLYFLKVIVNCNLLCKIRVEVVFFHLCLAHLDPRVVLHFKKFAQWV
jgi:hypothetical protein